VPAAEAVARARPVVAHLDLERVLAVAQRHGGARVGERFLHDPVSREVGARRQRPVAAFDG